MKFMGLRFYGPLIAVMVNKILFMFLQKSTSAMIVMHFCWPGYFLKKDLDQHEGKVVPWSLTGLLVLNFICALGVGAVTHPRLTPSERLENSLTCFVLLDIGKMVAHEGAIRDGVKKVSRWLPWQTQDNLQELCALTAISTMGLPGNLAWSPSRSTEIALETFFGSLRSQFRSSQMRCRD